MAGQILSAFAVVVYPTTTVGVACCAVSKLLGGAQGLLCEGQTLRTVTHVVCGTPTVKLIALCEEIWVPDMMIFQFPDTMEEKGIPLDHGVSMVMYV